LLERLVRLDTILDAGLRVDVGKVATGGATTDVIVEVSGADDFPVVFGAMPVTDVMLGEDRD
jgi:hypothetical protein